MNKQNQEKYLVTIITEQLLPTIVDKRCSIVDRMGDRIVTEINRHKLNNCITFIFIIYSTLQVMEFLSSCLELRKSLFIVNSTLSWKYIPKWL